MGKLTQAAKDQRNARMAALAGQDIMTHILIRDGAPYRITKITQQGNSCPFWICERLPEPSDRHDSGLVVVVDSSQDDWWF